MTTYNERVVQFCVDNCIRQRTWTDEGQEETHGLQSVSDMYAGYAFMHYFVVNNIVEGPRDVFDEVTLFLLAARVYPQGNSRGYRHVNVSIRGNMAVPPENVKRAMASLFAYGDRNDKDKWIKEFLDIHPFVNGNGRVAAILYNFFGGTMRKPVPLPYFYGEGP